MSDVFNIHEFKWDDVRAEQTILIVGRRGAGKSYLLKYALYRVRHFYDVVILFTPTRDVIDMFTGVIPNVFMFPSGGDIGALARIMNAANKLVDRHREVHILCVYDDTSWDADLLKSAEFREAYYNGRHSKITIWITAQDLVDMKLKLRAQCDYVFVMQDANCKFVKRYHEQFFSMFASPQQFMEVYAQATAHHGALILNNTPDKENGTMTIENSVFWFRAPPYIPPYRTCREVFWACAQLSSVLKPAVVEPKVTGDDTDEKAAPTTAPPRTRKKCSVRILRDGDL